MGHHEDYAPVGGRLVTRPFLVLGALALVGFGLIGVRLFTGIGAVSNLNDGYPLGVWIAYNVAVGTALGCGGYAVAILVYILNRWQYHTLMRSALLMSVFGYLLAGFAVLTDKGRYWNMYNLFLPSRMQPNSVLFEIALCVMTYNLVLVIEFLPTVLDKLAGSGRGRLAGLARRVAPKLDRVLLGAVVVGLTLPTMHQSSLGSLFVIAQSKLHPNWHTPLLPLLFLINCVFMGCAVVVCESIAASFAFGRGYRVRELSPLLQVASWLALAWLAVRLFDLAHRGQLPRAFDGGLPAVALAVELLCTLAGVAPVVFERMRRSPRWLFVTAAALLLGGGLFRFNVFLIGMDPGDGWRYFPSLAELLITFGIVSFQLLMYLVFVKRFPVLPSPHARPVATYPAPAAAVERRVAWQER
ncbi:MAG: Ni/Fe-hydrogenase cytochrome b subunit [Deferrisomatales bacterium]